MTSEVATAKAGLHYAAAHAAHYTTKDLHEALELYRGVMAEYPGTQEAGYSRTQIENIVGAVIPKQALFDAQLEMALTYVDHEGPIEVEPTPI